MVIAIPGLIWYRPVEIIERDKRGEELTSEDLLDVASTSFSDPIKLLGLAKSKNENDKKPYIREEYNLLRAEDNLEDGKLELEERKELLYRFPFIISEVESRDSKESIEDIINGQDLQRITEKLIEGSRNEAEIVFAKHFGKGVVLKELHKFSKDVKKAIKNSVAGIGDGMTYFLDKEIKGGLQTAEELRTYCYYVAGSVGRFLNELISIKDNIKLYDDQAVKFGEILQLINMAKGVRRDFEEGRVFLPTEFYPKFNAQYLFNGQEEDAKKVRAEALEKILSMAESNFDTSIEYIRSIPKELSGYRAFCLVPLILGIETLKTMRKSGAEKVFKGEETAIKFQYSIEKPMEFSYTIARSNNNGGTFDDFLKEYKKNPDKFSFVPKDYAAWAPEVLKQK